MTDSPDARTALSKAIAAYPGDVAKDSQLGILRSTFIRGYLTCADDERIRTNLVPRGEFQPLSIGYSDAPRAGNCILHVKGRRFHLAPDPFAGNRPADPADYVYICTECAALFIPEGEAT